MLGAFCSLFWNLCWFSPRVASVGSLAVATLLREVLSVLNASSVVDRQVLICAWLSLGSLLFL